TETGQHLLGYRYYDPAEGRYVNRDPIGIAGGVNVYGVVANDAVNWADPERLQSAAAAVWLARGGEGEIAGGGPEDPVADCVAVGCGIMAIYCLVHPPPVPRLPTLVHPFPPISIPARPRLLPFPARGKQTRTGWPGKDPGDKAGLHKNGRSSKKRSGPIGQKMYPRSY
ncbi:MAG: RHS repeat-associated core domain-containing protein, partial [Armatimonadetes bacterium]|nr:RHS repeat-associated core domain-containing protein [Armatimonadota bacterium]